MLGSALAVGDTDDSASLPDDAVVVRLRVSNDCVMLTLRGHDDVTVSGRDALAFDVGVSDNKGAVGVPVPRLDGDAVQLPEADCSNVREVESEGDIGEFAVVTARTQWWIRSGA